MKPFREGDGCIQFRGPFFDKGLRRLGITDAEISRTGLRLPHMGQIVIYIRRCSPHRVTMCGWTTCVPDNSPLDKPTLIISPRPLIRPHVRWSYSSSSPLGIFPQNELASSLSIRHTRCAKSSETQLALHHTNYTHWDYSFFWLTCSLASSRISLALCLASICSVMTLRSSTRLHFLACSSASLFVRSFRRSNCSQVR